MKQSNKHIQIKVIIGYALLFAIAIGSFSYFFKVSEQVDATQEVDALQAPLYRVSTILHLLYQSESADYKHFSRKTKQTQLQLDTLRNELNDDSIHQQKIDQIKDLLERKRYNTYQLLQAQREAPTAERYSQAVDSILQKKEVVAVDTTPQIDQIIRDTVLLRTQKQKFGKRFANLFRSNQQDTSFIIQRVYTPIDSTSIHRLDSMTQEIRHLQVALIKQQEEYQAKLDRNRSELRYNNYVLYQQINELMRQIRTQLESQQQAMIQKRHDLLQATLNKILLIAVVAVLVVFILIWIVARDLSRVQYFQHQLIKAKEYAESLLKNRERIMVAVSHDLRAPLSAIIQKNEQQPITDETIRCASTQMMGLLNNILQMYRFEMGKQLAQPTPFRMKQVAHELQQTYGILATQKNLAWQFSLDKETQEITLLLDEQLLKQALGNLLSNAIKFTQQGGVFCSFSIEKDRQNREVLCCKVSDTGIGISTSDQKRIFEAFTQADDVTKKEGFGLGLSITHQIATLLEGSLTLESQKEQGSTFTLTIPITRSEEVMEEVKQACLTLQSRSILIVDDDPLQRQLTERLFINLKMQTKTAASADEAISLLHQQDFDALFTDIQMPQKNGIELVKEIKRDHAFDSLPCIALSADISKTEEYYQQQGFAYFLLKPIHAIELQKILHTIPQRVVDKPYQLELLTAFTLGDKELEQEIFSCFKEEALKDLQILNETTKKNDRKGVAQVAHKMKSFVKQIAYQSLAEELQALETDAETMTEEELLLKTASSTRQMQALIDNLP